MRTRARRRWQAVGLFAVALNATCGGPRTGSEGQTVEGQPGRVADVDQPTETTRSALVEPPITPPALLATDPYGRLPGDGGVSLDGNYTYSVPIDVPPGRAGMAPSLSLAYSSRGGNGALGMGWRVTGLSSISRCTKTTSAGGTRVGVAIVPADDYCLDGIRLVKMSGTQGAANSVYRAESDIAAKIVVTKANSKGPTEWTVYSKNGRIATYAKPSSEIWTRRLFYDAAGNIPTAPPGTPDPPISSEDVELTWPITKETDRAYNKITYQYTLSSTAGSSFVLPYRVEYTKCDQTPCAYPDAQIRRVEFVYSSLPPGEDYLTAYTSGVFQTLQKQLSEVVVSVQSGTSTTYNAVRKYKLRYLRSLLTKRFLLKGIKLCDRLDVCIPETTFNWSAETGITHQVRGGETEAAPTKVVELLNFSVKPNTVPQIPGGGENYVPDSGLAVFDADGDGNDDVLAKEWMNLNDGWIDPWTAAPAPRDILFLGDGAGYFEEQRRVDLDGNGLASACTEGEIMEPAAAKPVDLDGDGSVELLATINTGCPLINVNNERYLPYIGLRGDAAAAPRLGVLAWNKTKRTLTRRALPMLDGAGLFSSKIELVDLNGDGLPELMGVNVAEPPPPTPPGQPPPPPPPTFPGTLTTSRNWQVWEASQPGLAVTDLPFVTYSNRRETSLLGFPFQMYGRFRRPTETVTDEDGDGRYELMQLVNDGTTRSYGWAGPMDASLRGRHAFRDTINQSMGSWDLPVSRTDPSWGTPTDADPRPGNSLWRFADVNGDGLKDAFYRKVVNGTASWEVRPNTGNGYGLPRPLGRTAEATRVINLYPGDSHVDDIGTRKGVDNGLRVADMNGDGRDDLVLLRPEKGGALHRSGYLYSTKPPRVMYSNGYNFDDPIELPAHGQQRLWREHSEPSCTVNCRDIQMQFPMSGIGDFDGNGIADIAEFVVHTNGTLIRRALKVYSLPLPGGADKIVGVRDHMLTNAQSITYDSMSAGSFRRLGLPDTTPDTHVSDLTQTATAAQCKYPARCMARGLPVVAKLVDTRHARSVSNSYNYTGGRSDAMGKGWLGFRETRVTDGITGRVTYRKFDNQPWRPGSAIPKYRHFPRAFQPYSIVVGEPGTGANHASSLSDATGMIQRSSTSVTRTHVTKGPTGEEIVALQKAKTVEVITDMPPNFPVGEYTTDVTYDDYGNPTLTTTKQQDFSGPNPTTYNQRDVTVGYTNDETNWLIGMAHTVTDLATTTKDVYATGCTSGICRSSTRVTTYDYNPANGLLTKIHRNPGSSDASVKGDTIFTRDSAGLVTKVRRLSADREGGGAGPTCTTNAQCIAGESCINEGGVSMCRRAREQSIQYDATGSAGEGFTNAAGHVSWRLADPATGLTFATVDPNGFERVIKRDGLGRPREATGEDGSKTSTSYGAFVTPFSAAIAFGLVDRYTVLDGQSVTDVFDANGRLWYRTWSTFDNQTGVLRFTYDALGNVNETRYVTVATAHATATTTSLATTLNAAATGTVIQTARYDAQGRPVTTTEGASNTTSYSYTTSMAVGETDPVGNFRLVHRDARGLIKEVSEYLANTAGQQLRTFYNYDERGNLARLAPPEAPHQTFEYDILGRRTKWEIYAAFSPRTFAAYDSFDQVAYDQDAFYTRDALGRVTARDSSAAEDQRYVWDVGTGAIGKLSSARTLEANGTGTEHETVNTYDTLGRLTQRRERFKNGDSLSVGFGYDTRGRLGSIRYPEASGSGDTAVTASATLAGPTVGYVYKNGQLESLRDVNDSNKVLWQATKRHLFGMIAEAKTSNNLTTTWTYYADTLRPFTQATTGVGGALLPNQTFKYYANGMLQERNSSGTVETYQYDRTNRLSKYHRDGQVMDAEFKYTGAGHMTTVDMTTSTNSPDWPLADETMTNPGSGSLDADQLRNLTVGSNPRVGYGFDHPGNRVIEEKSYPANVPAGVLKRTYQYNSFNLPAVIDDVASGRKFTFLYDAGGTRVRKTSSAGDDVAYIGQLYERRNLPSYSSKETVYRLIADGGVVGELGHAWNSNSRNMRFFFKDHQGSIAFEIANNQTRRHGFFPYGKRSGTPPAQAFSQLGYTGHSHDDDLGLINMRGRIYHVAQRRFITTDPMLGTPFRTGGANPYAYVRNNPVNFTDPSGFNTQTLPEMTIVGDPLSAQMEAAMNDPNTGINASMQQGFSDGMSAAASANADAERNAAANQAINDPVTGLNASKNNAIPDYGSPAQAQEQINHAYGELGLNYGRAPTFNPNHPKDSNAQIQPGGVVIGPMAFESPAQLKTTMQHEHKHIQQWAEGRLARGGLHRMANEAEARYAQLEPENARRAGLTPELQAALELDLKAKLETLMANGAWTYVHQLLVPDADGNRQKVQPPPSALMGPAPSWIKPSP